MDNKDEIFDDIEIIDENEFKEIVAKRNEPINNDWLSDFTNVEKAEPQYNENDVNVEDTTNDSTNTYETPNLDPIMEEPLEESTPLIEDATEVLNNVELTDPNSTINYQANSLESEEKKDIDEEEELNNNRSVMFIVLLFTILIIFIFLLPAITNIIK